MKRLILTGIGLVMLSGCGGNTPPASTNKEKEPAKSKTEPEKSVPIVPPNPDKG